MEKYIICNIDQFADILAPIIESYAIEKNERLTIVIKECYGRLKEITVDDKSGIQLLINKLIETITCNKLDHEQSRLVDDICIKIMMKCNKMEKEIQSLGEKNAEMQKEVQNLGEKNAEMQKEVQNLRQQSNGMQVSIESMQIRMDVAECYNVSFDLTNLFVFYYVSPLLKTISAYKNYKDWNSLKEQISILKRKIKNQEINESDLQTFVGPLQNQLNGINVNILKVHDLIQERHVRTHTKVRSKEEQQQFLETLENFKFSNHFIYRDLVENIFCLLKKNTLRRYVN